MNTKKVLGLTTAAIIAMTALAGCGQTDDTSTASSGSSFDTNNEITVVSRESGSGTRGAFIELFGIEEKEDSGNKVDHTTDEAIVANKTDVMLTNVSGDEYSIGYVSLGSLSDKVKALKIDGTDATAENVKNGTYKISRPFNIATKDGVSEVAQDFINFILSKEGQEVVTDGYIPVDENAAPYSGTKPEGKVVVAGSSSVSPIMEKLKEAYIAVNPSANIEVLMSDSTTGMTSAMEGTCDIGMASRDLSDKEKASLTATPIALDGIAVIVSNDNPTEGLTSDQVKGIYTGTITSWSELN